MSDTARVIVRRQGDVFECYALPSNVGLDMWRCGWCVGVAAKKPGMVDPTVSATCPECGAVVVQVVNKWDVYNMGESMIAEPATMSQVSYLRALLVGMLKYPEVVRNYVEEQVGHELTSLVNAVAFEKLSRDEASKLISGIIEVKKEMTTLKNYIIRVESPFLLTPTQIKSKLGIGFKVIGVEVEKEVQKEVINDVDSAVHAIIRAGFRVLARAHHPDVGGDTETMMVLNRAKKEIEEVMKQLL